MLGEFRAHEAGEDVAALALILKMCKAALGPTVLTSLYVLARMSLEKGKLERQSTFAALVRAKALSTSIAAKAAASGLIADGLVQAYRSDPSHGIERVFKEKTNAGRRVTARKSIISSISNYLATQ